MLAGVRMPCQWMEVGTLSRLVTFRVTVSPWRKRSTGLGMDPLMAVAVAGRPVMFTRMGAMVRSNRVPDSTGIWAWAEAASACPGRRLSPRPAMVPAAATPCTNRRRPIPPACDFLTRGSFSNISSKTLVGISVM
jgi:hypothetical protein